MRNVLPVLTGLLLGVTHLAAQDPAFIWHTARSQHLFPEEAPTAYVIADDVALRDAQGTHSGLLALLGMGAPIVMEQFGTDSSEVNGVKSLWYKVSSEKGQGWMWGGYIAQHAFGSTGDPHVKFLSGLERIISTDSTGTLIRYRLIALRNGKEQDRIVLDAFGWGFEGIENNGNRGLDNVDDIITLHVPCVGGCGCTTGDVVVFWSGGRFHHVADLMGSPDGEWSGVQTFIYPSDMEGEAGMIKRVTSMVDDERAETDQERGGVSRLYMEEYLRWNGQALVPHGRPTKEQRYFMTTDR